MTTAGTRTPSTVFVTHHGIEYPGELVRVPNWQPSLGEALTADAYFRVAFVETASSVSPRTLHDPRIAVYVPGERDAALERAERELRIMRQAMGTQVTSADPFDALTDETREVENWAVGMWAESFKDGHLIATPPLEADLTEIFRDGYWSTWAERIGRLLLERAYAGPAVRADLLQVPLRPEADAPILFDALMTGEGASATFAIDSFGPGLGLTSAASPRNVDLTRNDVAQRLTSMTAEGLPPDAIGHALAHKHGLTYPLATLFLLLWIRDGHHSARLRPGHSLLRRDGQRYPGDALTSADVPSLRWPLRLWERIESLSPATTAAPIEPYLAALAGPVGQTESPSSAAERQLAELRDDLAEVARALRHIAAAQGSGAPLLELDHLHEIAAASTIDEATRTAARLERDPAAFAEAMDLWRAWAAAALHGDALARAIGWVNAAAVDDEADVLRAERTALLERLRDRHLLRTPHEWAAIADNVRAFQQRYADAYLAHHRNYHDEVGLLAHEVAGVSLKAQALDRLNGAAELGPPVGAGLSALADELRNDVVACDVQRDLDDVARAPVCPGCGMHLGATPPTNGVKQTVALVNEALTTQNQRLAAQVAHRLAEREGSDDLDTLVNVTQAGDLSGLANVLDDNLVDFIRNLLRNGARA